MNKTYNIIELFSGIGSQAKALENLGITINVLGTCEWDIHSIVAYDLIHNDTLIDPKVSKMSRDELQNALSHYSFSNSGKAPMSFDTLKTYSLEALQRIYSSILRNNNFVDINELNGFEMAGNVDILTYSFPCQDLSNVGAFHGFKSGIDKGSGSRSSLIWQVGRILSEMKENNIALPRFLLMENVPTLLSERHFANFKTWLNDLEELGYVNKYYPLNASSFGIPQNRPRLLMISAYVGHNKSKRSKVEEYFASKPDPQNVIDDYQRSKYYQKYSIKDLLQTDYRKNALREEAVECTPNDTISRRKIWKENAQLVVKGANGPVINRAHKVVGTLTTKQDRHPNSGNLYFDSGIEGRSKYRYLTPRECMLFMGFTNEDYERLKENPIEFHKGKKLFARDVVIRMAGNSIPVKLLEGVFYQITKLDDYLKK